MTIEEFMAQFDDKSFNDGLVITHWEPDAQKDGYYLVHFSDGLLGRISPHQLAMNDFKDSFIYRVNQYTKEHRAERNASMIKDWFGVK